MCKTGDIELPYETEDVAAGCDKRNNYACIFNNKKFWEELIALFPLIRYGQHRK
jgi:hypothetical protein